MATMLNGAAVMDAALLLIGEHDADDVTLMVFVPLGPKKYIVEALQQKVSTMYLQKKVNKCTWVLSAIHEQNGDQFVFFSAGNESCPQPQTSEHLAAIEIMKLKHILILQNKIDLVKESQAKEQYEQILAFVQGTSVWSLAIGWSVMCNGV